MGRTQRRDQMDHAWMHANYLENLNKKLQNHLEDSSNGGHEVSLLLVYLRDCKFCGPVDPPRNVQRENICQSFYFQ
ncbi:hypothetical protein L2E82_01040 [Cichorium intybus]|uniref:Uncharacterized protein n=1 Tax=Cichorium intybus TaxID=13427 RepID=A0ACB9GXQ4_CICIN|nr:hypothetical protein L2E82_01040 [Cichorium intybus]